MQFNIIGAESTGNLSCEGVFVQVNTKYNPFIIGSPFLELQDEIVEE